MDLICFPQPQVAPPAGASSGGTTVRILTTGAPFREYTASVACRFNRATVVPATILDVNSVACVSPPAPSHESTSVSQPTDPPESMCTSSDGKRIVSGHHDGTVRVFSVFGV